MRNEKNFINEVNHNNAALETELRCDCGGDLFRISHSGYMRKGLFGGVSIYEKENQLLIKCDCVNCCKQYHLYNSTKDGTSPREISVGACEPLRIKDETRFKIKLRYNFMEMNYKTDQFEMFFLDVKLPNGTKYITICEI